MPFLFAVRDLTQYAEFLQVREVQQQVWGFTQGEGLYPPMLKTAAENGFSVATTIQEGSAADRVVDNAVKLRKDLIVMGTFGWTGVNRAIMGSTTERVIMNSPCPVLVVR